MDIIDDVGRLFDSLEWFPAEMPEGTTKEGNKYLTAFLNEGDKYVAFESVIELGQLTDEELATVSVRRGPHGIDLVAPGKPRQCNQLLAIIDNDGLVTWYPGTPTVAINLAKATVKLV